MLNDRRSRAFYNQYTSITDPEDTVDRVLADIEEKWKDDGWKQNTSE